MIAVNQGDSKEVINKYVAENRYAFKVGMPPPGYGIFNDYRVQVYPTNYLLDGNGKIVYRAVGFDEAKMREALAKLGVK